MISTSLVKWSLSRMTGHKIVASKFNADDLSALRRQTSEFDGSPDNLMYRAALAYLELTDSLESKRQSDNLLKQLRLALGIEPKSERNRKSGNPRKDLPSDRPPTRAEVEEALSYHRKYAKTYRDFCKRHKRKANELEGIFKNMPIEDIVLTPEELAESEIESAAYAEHLAIGQRCDLACAQSMETLMRGIAPTADDAEEFCEVNRSALKNVEIVEEWSEERTRIDFSFNITKVNVEVEKLSIMDGHEHRIVSASTWDIGPPKMRVTWDFLANTAILTSQYAMPFNRLSGLVSSDAKRFTGSELARYFQYVASRIAPIYLQLGKDLANAPVLSGDDTSVRVIEVQKALKLLKSNPAAQTPWQSYATAELAEATLEETQTKGVAALLASEFGFEFDKKQGEGTKIKLNTTVISGRKDEHDPRSLIVFYRTHLGSFGNLLDMILENRKSSLRKLIIQSDLSTTNLISKPHLASNLEVTLAGCASHARRPFSLYKEDDELCESILFFFSHLTFQEHGLDLHGRNTDNSNAVRGIHGREQWEEILHIAKILTHRWSKKTPIGDGAHYIIKHYDKLTAYLTNPMLLPNNNFSERMLRMEKIIQDNALFRQSLEGRFCLDIVRTVNQTATAVGVAHQDYLKWVLHKKPEEIDQNPERFTPLAYSRSTVTVAEKDLHSQTHLN
jgi:Transposase IS66 family